MELTARDLVITHLYLMGVSPLAIAGKLDIKAYEVDKVLESPDYIKYKADRESSLDRKLIERQHEALQTMSDLMKEGQPEFIRFQVAKTILPTIKSLRARNVVGEERPSIENMLVQINNQAKIFENNPGGRKVIELREEAINND